jgi:hypothetical protein
MKGIGARLSVTPASYVLRMDDGKILNADWESGYDRWSIGERIILTTENGSGIMFSENRRTRVAVFPYDPSQIESRATTTTLYRDANPDRFD